MFYFPYTIAICQQVHFKKYINEWEVMHLMVYSYINVVNHPQVKLVSVTLRYSSYSWGHKFPYAMQNLQNVAFFFYF